MTELVDRLGRMLRSRGQGGQLLRGSGIALLTLLAGMAASYLVNIYLARLLGTAELGRYALALSWATLLLIPAGLGQHMAMLRLLPEYRVQERWDLFRGLLRQSWWLTVASGLALGLIGAAAGRLLTSGWELVLGFALVPVLGLLNVQSAMLRVQHRIFWALAPNNLLRFVGLAGAVALLLWLGYPARGLTVLVALLITLLVLAAIQQWVLRHNWEPEVLAEPPRFLTREWLGIALPMLFTSSSLVVLNRSDVVMLGMLASSSEVGVYFVTARVAALTAFAMTAVNSISGPLFSAAHARGDRAGLQRLAAGVAHLSFWPSLGVALLLIGFGEPLLGLFGPEFVAGRWPLTLLVAGYLINVGAGAVAALLNMSGHQNDTARVYGVAVLLNVLLNLTLIPSFGTLGAAAATAATMAMWNLWLVRIVRRRLGIDASLLGLLWRARRG